MAQTREERITKIAKQLAQGGWSSIYSYVDENEPEEFDDEDEDDDEEED